MWEKKEAFSLARYTIQDTLGTGGMGTVYRAHHEILSRPVALKVPRPELAQSDVFVQRFLREARALGTLNHPNIVSVYDAGIEDDTPYIAMEYVAGETLSDRIYQTERLVFNLVIRWGIQMARALAYLHDRNILHRDLKSANVIINERGDAVIADFGIAQIDPDSDLTQGMIGTPSYMSPEQAMGRPLDVRSDLYSLGIILYECIAGDVPFVDDNSFALLQKVIHEPPVPLLSRRPDTPEWLAALVDRCLSKSPDVRYADGHELLAAFEPGMGAVDRPLLLPATTGITRPHKEPSAAEHLSLAIASLARSLSKPRWQTLKPQSSRSTPDPTVTMYAPMPTLVKPAPAPSLARRSIKPLTVLAIVFAVVALLTTPYIELAPTTARTPMNSTEQPLLMMESNSPELGLEPAAAVSENNSSFSPWESQIPSDEDSSTVVSDSALLPERLAYELDLAPLTPVKPKMLDSNPEIELDVPASDEMGPAEAEIDASRLPEVLRELAVQEDKTDLRKALEAFSDEERLQYGGRQHVKEPDLAFIFLVNTTDQNIRALLVPTQEGWMDYYSGKAITEEEGRFYERNEGIDATLKWWLSDVEPIWVEALQVSNTSKKKRKSLGW